MNLRTVDPASRVVPARMPAPMLAIICSAALQGIEAEPVDVEVNANEVGDPKINLVGLPDAAVKESDDRVVSALTNSGFFPPRTRMTINLAPAHVRKEGPCYDLPIAIGILCAMHQLDAPQVGDYLIAGELGLSGATRPIRGALAMARMARSLGKKRLLLPPVSAEEAALVDGVEVYRIESLDQAVRFLRGEIQLSPVDAPQVRARYGGRGAEDAIDFHEIKGQQTVRRAIEVAVAGAHNLLMVGPPGSGKSMLAKRIPTIMPPPTVDEHLEILSIHSAAGRTITGETNWGSRPFRSPHHTVSDVALLGGGTIPGPGEISLAHHGVLFLDELPEFKRSALEVMRQPLEDCAVTISRSAGKVTLPCAFMLVAAMNPCPQGFSFSLSYKDRPIRTPFLASRDSCYLAGTQRRGQMKPWFRHLRAVLSNVVSKNQVRQLLESIGFKHYGKISVLERFCDGRTDDPITAVTSNPAMKAIADAAPDLCFAIVHVRSFPEVVFMMKGGPANVFVGVYTLRQPQLMIDAMLNFCTRPGVSDLSLQIHTAWESFKLKHGTN